MVDPAQTEGIQTDPEGDEMPTSKDTSAGAPRLSRLAKFVNVLTKSEGEQAATEHPPTVPFLKLFRFTTRVEKLMMTFSCLCAFIHGAILPLWTIALGSVIEVLAKSTPDDKTLVSEISGLAKWFIVLAVIAFIVSFFQVRVQMVVAQRTSSRMRTRYVESLMRQELEWYDGERSGELTSRVSSDVDLVQAGIGDKLGSAIQFISTFAVGFVIAFIYSWQLTLIVLAVSPVLAICGFAFSKAATDAVGEGQTAYSAAGSIASEVLSLVKTVSAYGGQEEECRRYDKQLDIAYKNGVKKSLSSAMSYGFTFFFIFCIYG
jgi:ATP-binding cassette, subfamily B (MDR/TAP), member 1